MVLREISLFLIVSCVYIDARSVDGIRSDAIETKYVPDPMETKNLYRRDSLSGADLEDASDAQKPGWMVRTYRKLKNVFVRPKSETDSGNEVVNKENELNNNQEQRTQLMRFGAITSRVSNSLGGASMKVAGIIEKLCRMLKTVIPIVAAVCNVGQFKFCTSADAPLELGEAMSRPLDLNAPDK